MEKEKRIKNHELQFGEEYFAENLFERAGCGGKGTAHKYQGRSKERRSSDCVFFFFKGRCEFRTPNPITEHGYRSREVEQHRRKAQAHHFLCRMQTWDKVLRGVLQAHFL